MDNQHQINLLALSKLLNFLLVLGFGASMVVNVALGLSLAKTSSEKSRTLVPLKFHKRLRFQTPRWMPLTCI